MPPNPGEGSYRDRDEYEKEYEDAKKTADKGGDLVKFAASRSKSNAKKAEEDKNKPAKFGPSKRPSPLKNFDDEVDDDNQILSSKHSTFFNRQMANERMGTRRSAIDSVRHQTDADTIMWNGMKKAFGVTNDADVEVKGNGYTIDPITGFPVMKTEDSPQPGPKLAPDIFSGVGIGKERPTRTGPIGGILNQTPNGNIKTDYTPEPDPNVEYPTDPPRGQGIDGTTQPKAPQGVYVEEMMSNPPQYRVVDTNKGTTTMVPRGYQPSFNQDGSYTLLPQTKNQINPKEDFLQSMKLMSPLDTRSTGNPVSGADIMRNGMDKVFQQRIGQQTSMSEGDEMPIAPQQQQQQQASVMEGLANTEGETMLGIGSRVWNQAQGKMEITEGEQRNIGYAINGLAVGKDEAKWAVPVLENIARVAWYKESQGKEGPPENADEGYVKNWIGSFLNGENPTGAKELNEDLKRMGIPGVDNLKAQKNFTWALKALNQNNPSSYRNPAAAAQMAAWACSAASFAEIANAAGKDIRIDDAVKLINANGQMVTASQGLLTGSGAWDAVINGFGSLGLQSQKVNFTDPGMVLEHFNNGGGPVMFTGPGTGNAWNFQHIYVATGADKDGINIVDSSGANKPRMTWREWQGQTGNWASNGTTGVTVMGPSQAQQQPQGAGNYQAEQFIDVAKQLKGTPIENIKQNLPLIEDTFAKWGMSDPETIASAIATVTVETGSGRDSWMPIRQYGYGANSGDTWHGRGFVQLTGASNYRAASQAVSQVMGKDVDLVNNPELAMNPEVAANVMAWYYKTRGVSEAAQRGDWRATRTLVNGGTNGINEYNAVLRALGKRV